MTVYLSVTGAHIVGQNNRGTFRLPPDESIISQEHMDEVTEIARDIAAGAGTIRPAPRARPLLRGRAGKPDQPAGLTAGRWT